LSLATASQCAFAVRHLATLPWLLAGIAWTLFAPVIENAGFPGAPIVLPITLILATAIATGRAASPGPNRQPPDQT
jgi:hypothetical protein